MTDVLLRGAEYIYQTHVVTKRICPDFLSMGPGTPGDDAFETNIHKREVISLFVD